MYIPKLLRKSVTVKSDNVGANSVRNRRFVEEKLNNN